MGIIVKFMARPANRIDKQKAGSTGGLVIFPGVRYERANHSNPPKPKVQPARTRLRDRS